MLKVIHDQVGVLAGHIPHQRDQFNEGQRLTAPRLEKGATTGATTGSRVFHLGDVGGRYVTLPALALHQPPVLVPRGVTELHDAHPLPGSQRHLFRSARFERVHGVIDLLAFLVGGAVPLFVLQTLGTDGNSRLLRTGAVRHPRHVQRRLPLKPAGLGPPPGLQRSVLVDGRPAALPTWPGPPGRAAALAASMSARALARGCAVTLAVQCDHSVGKMGRLGHRAIFLQGDQPLHRATGSAVRPCSLMARAALVSKAASAAAIPLQRRAVCSLIATRYVALRFFEEGCARASCADAQLAGGVAVLSA